MELTFLGTSSMVPTKDRNQSSVLLSYSSEGILFDCGEATQRQLKIAGIKPTKITRIVISHWHGDHVLGLPGLIQTLGASDYAGTLSIYGPRGTKKHMKSMFDAFVFDSKVDLEVVDISAGIFFENRQFIMEADHLSHSIECLGFRFTEKDRRRINVAKARAAGIPDGPLLGKLQDNQPITWKGKTYSPPELTYVVKGKQIAFIADTVPCQGAINLSKDADLLICEATFESSLEEKSEAYGHMTSKQAALLANHASAKKLILTHFSQRYKTTKDIEEEAKTYFTNSVCAYDFMRVRL
ncbi:MAG: ribonuclease Z [archaeon]